jgi:cytoskeletal protein RodZ
MESLGEFLKHGREEASLTLEELAQRTRIRIENLEALEREDLDSLPTDIYVRGFVKLVCREVGLAPEDGLARYESLRSTAGPADEIIWSEEKEVTEPGWLERALRDPERVVRTATTAVKWGGLTLGGVAILLVVVAGVKALRSDGEAPAPTPAVAGSEVAEPKAIEDEKTEPSSSETKPAPAEKKPAPKQDPPKSARAETPKKKPQPEPVELALVEPEIPERNPEGTIEAGDPVAAAEKLAAEQAAAEKRAEERAAAEKRAQELAAAERKAADDRRAAEKAEAQRLEEQAAADQLARQKVTAEKAEEDRLVAEKAAASPETARAEAPKPSPPSPRPPRTTSDERLVLVVEALRSVEVEVLLDGVGHPRSRGLTPGESKTWKADSLFLLSATDGGAVRITLDGVDLGVPGQDGEPLVNRPVRRRR